MAEGDSTRHGAQGAVGWIPTQTMREATGRNRDEWFAALDAAGAACWGPERTAAYIEQRHPEISPWWRLSIAVAYRRACASPSDAAA